MVSVLTNRDFLWTPDLAVACLPTLSEHDVLALHRTYRTRAHRRHTYRHERRSPLTRRHPSLAAMSRNLCNDLDRIQLRAGSRRS